MLCISINLLYSFRFFYYYIRWRIASLRSYFNLKISSSRRFLLYYYSFCISCNDFSNYCFFLFSIYFLWFFNYLMSNSAFLWAFSSFCIFSCFLNNLSREPFPFITYISSSSSRSSSAIFFFYYSIYFILFFLFFSVGTSAFLLGTALDYINSSCSSP